MKLFTHFMYICMQNNKTNTMPLEIERKFLVGGEFRPSAIRVTRIMQGYLSSVPERTVRIRLRDNKGYLTVKGLSNHSGTSRYEWEKEIPAEDALQLLELCEPGVIDKTRYNIPAGRHIYEVDEFHGENAGLILAEIELSSENEIFEKPSWLGNEVTGNPIYYNASLSKTPYKNWIPSLKT